jgi:hypothetical protein
MLDADPTSAAFNAYCTLEEAEAYMDTLAFKEAWEGKMDTQKEAALIQAARWMDRLPWKGARTAMKQPLAWPRAGIAFEGHDIPENEIPLRVKEANAEFALRLLKKDRAADAKKGVSIGSLRTSDQERRLIPDSVRDLVQPFLVVQGGIRLVRS